MRDISLSARMILALAEAGVIAYTYSGFKMPKPQKKQDEAISLEKMEKAQAKRQRRANKLLGIK